MVDGDLAEGLAAMDADNENLMDALMKAVARGRPNRVEWSGMEIAAVVEPVPNPQPVLLPDHPQQQAVDIDIVQIDVGGGAVQLSWSGLEAVALRPKPARTVQPMKVIEEQAKLTFTKVKVKGGGEQYAFL